MTHPIPPGTRDILPDEMRELRALQTRLGEVFERFGYGEVATPTVEYDEVLALAGEAGAPAAHRFFDSGGDLLAMRSDMTVPIARLVGNRYQDADLPLRFFYNARAYRAVRPQRGQMGEFFQAGIELIGAEAPGGTVEAIEVLAAALDAAGLNRAVIGLGDASLYAGVLGGAGVDGPDRIELLDLLAGRDLVGLGAALDRLELRDEDRVLLGALPGLRGGREVFDRARDLGAERVGAALAPLEQTFRGVEQRGIGDRVALDLGLLRALGYYTGAILEVYDPALGHVLGGGGRYDELMGRLGRPLPAVGFALYLERVHVAQAEEERIAGKDSGS
ncbi:MAG: ATP phosphoribosyltransferase regulatory subunit [Actinomycetota bacterium]|nr:ATP phosphoribosyltransferase regulatory subunit [Actinomycetota bacterium]